MFLDGEQHQLVDGDTAVARPGPRRRAPRCRRRRWRAPPPRNSLQHYLDASKSGGAEPPAWDEAWEQYRRGIVYGYFLWGITRLVDEPADHRRAAHPAGHRHPRPRLVRRCRRVAAARQGGLAMTLDDRSVVITGAGSGVGRASALRFAAAGRGSCAPTCRTTGRGDRAPGRGGRRRRGGAALRRDRRGRRRRCDRGSHRALRPARRDVQQRRGHRRGPRHAVRGPHRRGVRTADQHQLPRRVQRVQARGDPLQGPGRRRRDREHRFRRRHGRLRQRGVRRHQGRGQPAHTVAWRSSAHRSASAATRSVPGAMPLTNFTLGDADAPFGERSEGYLEMVAQLQPLGPVHHRRGLRRRRPLPRVRRVAQPHGGAPPRRRRLRGASTPEPMVRFRVRSVHSDRYSSGRAPWRGWWHRWEAGTTVLPGRGRRGSPARTAVCAARPASAPAVAHVPGVLVGRVGRGGAVGTRHRAQLDRVPSPVRARRGAAGDRPRAARRGRAAGVEPGRRGDRRGRERHGGRGALHRGRRRSAPAVPPRRERRLMAGLGGRTAVVGIGQTEFSKASGRSELQLASEAVRAAIDDAGPGARRHRRHRHVHRRHQRRARTDAQRRDA